MMNETYSSAMATSAAGRRTAYTMSTGRPRMAATASLWRFDSHQCGIQSGHTAIASSMSAKGSTLEIGGAALAGMMLPQPPIAGGGVTWYIVDIYPPALSFPEGGAE